MSKGTATQREGSPPVLEHTPPVALPTGYACAVVGNGRLVAVLWERSRAGLERILDRHWRSAGTEAAADHPAARFLAAYSCGAVLPGAETIGIRIAWERVGQFDRSILRAAAQVPYGRTVSYGDVARTAGYPGAARAAGGALSRNPWPIVVPCHRIVGADGRLVGFGKGMGAKEALIRFEAENAARPSRLAAGPGAFGHPWPRRRTSPA